MFGFISQKNIAVTANGIVEKPAAEIFGFIAPHFFENYAKWCPEVIEIECLSEAPVHQNSRGRDRKSTRLNSSHIPLSRMPSSA